jgi:hypothetical protein
MASNSILEDTHASADPVTPSSEHPNAKMSLKAYLRRASVHGSEASFEAAAAPLSGNNMNNNMNMTQTTNESGMDQPVQGPSSFTPSDAPLSRASASHAREPRGRGLSTIGIRGLGSLGLHWASAESTPSTWSSSRRSSTFLSTALDWIHGAFGRAFYYLFGPVMGVLGYADTWHMRNLLHDFVAEMRVLAKLRHPNITTVMGAVIDAQCPMLVMEHMEHGSLYDLLHNDTVAIDSEVLLPMLRDIVQVCGHVCIYVSVLCMYVYMLAIKT